MQLALLVTGILLTLGALVALVRTSKAKGQEGIQAGSVFLAVAVMFGLGVIFLALVI